MSTNTNDGLTRSGLLYSCTRMATVGVKGLKERIVLHGETQLRTPTVRAHPGHTPTWRKWTRTALTLARHAGTRFTYTPEGWKA